jgi:virginiamycin A acetyltransferase
LLDGAVLRQGCVVAAASVVRSEVPAYSVNAGQPLRVVGWRE